MLIDIDTLAAIQNERYSDFVREVEKSRLLRLQKENNNLTQQWVTEPASAPTLYQMLVTAMQTHIRSLLAH
jgi:hypothetical protein